VRVERQRLRQELAEFEAEIEDKLHQLFIQRMEFREEIEGGRARVRTEHRSTPATGRSQTFQSWESPETCFAKHLRGLGIVS
jgi:hypothetical protein